MPAGICAVNDRLPNYETCARRYISPTHSRRRCIDAKAMSPSHLKLSPIILTKFTKAKPARPRELAKVQKLAQRLAKFMDLPDIQRAIGKAHVVRASSVAIQEALIVEAGRMGFVSERRGLFAQYETAGIRPDYYLKVGRSGILMEVERGKTLANNMDLLDIWKCHICREADYLFLIVPKRRPRGSGKSDSINTRVLKRVGTFFQRENYVNIEAVFVFAY